MSNRYFAILGEVPKAMNLASLMKALSRYNESRTTIEESE